MQVCSHDVLPLQPITHVRSDLQVPVHELYWDAHVVALACVSHDVQVPPLDDVWQVPWTHEPVPHEFPHEPQLFGSESVSTHFEPHDVCVDWHACNETDSVDVVATSIHACGWIVWLSSEPTVFASS